MASRGRLGTNRKQHVRLLQELYKIAEEKKLGVGISVKILFNIISSLFEINTKISDFMEFSKLQQDACCCYGASGHSNSTPGSQTLSEVLRRRGESEGRHNAI
ncbi:hypothetical protein KIN20_032110 [Parelaphostrongylus tenuis]|uniref:Eukaryotic translation initiation factor 3 subunit C N-terminal domain-containing protein n=1 Tax=Parelaphostrongylus tenuis TaxID=148309 RepID=A0AAD5R6G9_PARTN|nr:hypothetical protein KIN20_032110 [Parelaphostrongylus tenuis]